MLLGLRVPNLTFTFTTADRVLVDRLAQQTPRAKNSLLKLQLANISSVGTLTQVSLVYLYWFAEVTFGTLCV